MSLPVCFPLGEGLLSILVLAQPVGGEDAFPKPEFPRRIDAIGESSEQQQARVDTYFQVQYRIQIETDTNTVSEQEARMISVAHTCY